MPTSPEYTIITITIEMLLCRYFLCKTLGLKESSKIAYQMLAFLLMLIPAVWAAINYPHTFWRPFLSMAQMFAVVLILFKGNIKEKVLYLFILLTVLYIQMPIVVLLNFAFRKWELSQYGYFFSLFIMVVPVYTTLFLVINAFLIIYERIKKYVAKKHYMILTCLSGMIFILLTVLFQTSNIVVVMAFLVMVYLSWVFVLALFYYTGRYYSKAGEAAVLAYQNSMIEKYLAQYKRSDEMLRILSHDLKHHLQIWQTRAVESGANETVKDIEAYAERLNDYDLIHVNNETANAILNQKRFECLEQGVDFIVKGGFDNDLVLSKIDMAALLGNLLDNAFEAAVQTEAPAQRKINLHIKRKNHFLYIEIKNGCTQEPLKENNVFISSKTTGGNHGIGMVSIEKVLENYNGAFQTAFSDGFFSVSVMLRAYSDM